MAKQPPPPQPLHLDLATSHEDKNGAKCEDGFPAILQGKRILLATESLGPVNGVSRTTLSLVDYLRRNGVQLAIVAPHSKETRLRPQGNNVSELRLPGYPLPYNPDLTVVYPFQLEDVYKRTFKPDVVYLASPASTGFQFLLQIRQLQEPPVVLLNFQTDLSAYSEILFPGPVAKFSVWLLGVVQGFLFSHRSVHTIFYPSSGIRRYLLKAGAPSSRLVQLGRGVDTALFHPSRRDEAYRKELAPKGELILVCVCRLAPEKGFEFLAQVTSRLVDQNFPFKLVIVGGNLNPGVENDVRQLFHSTNDHVVFTGLLTGTSLARAYASADVFLHCSVTETFGLVVLEAMASGVPVVARDEGGPSDIVQHAKTGYLVPPHDLDTFVSLVRGFSDTALLATMGENAREFALETTWDKINRRVAWQLAEGLQEHLRIRQRKRPIRNWLANRYYDFKSDVVVPWVVAFRLHIAVILVYIIWMMAAAVLLLYGNKLVPKNWHFLQDIPLIFQEGSRRFSKQGLREFLRHLSI
ncbi:hypothetical protein PV08_08060 [Exophiala spinifera]|uniref:Glycosyl transferase family 1 domain-containing protein n=1 Tax=Exophiala spinifera TaxID=91928 RepID=A0A0D2B1S1_9EURO|nr:uncharacterized protein PV08_08060 [Exophiala spinifera]KIW12873.1 hypothetical protein PV08_08060 [Exophiala spinifera]